MILASADRGPIEIAPGRGDLRYGSVLSPFTGPPVSPGPYPSWFGLHADPFSTVNGTGNAGIYGGTQQPISHANIFGTQPLVFAAVMRLLTWSLKVPLKMYRRTGENSRERLYSEDHPLAAALINPWERAGPAQLTMNFLGPLLVHGNSILRVNQGRGGAIEFVPRDWRFLTPAQAFPNRISGWYSTEDGDKETFTVDQAVHVAFWSPLAPVGLSPLTALGTTLFTEQMARRYASNNLKNMARPPSAITVSEQFLTYDKDTRDQIMAAMRQQVSDIYSGPDNAGKTAILPAGLEWKQVGHTAVEAELIDQRKINRDEINTVYQIPGPMAGDLEHATYSNVETLKELAYTDSLGPYLVLIEAAVTSQVVWAMLGETDAYVEYDFGGVLRGNRLQEIQALREGIGTGIYSINEARTFLNMPKSEEAQADALWLPTNNLTPVGDVITPSE